MFLILMFDQKEYYQKHKEKIKKQVFDNYHKNLEEHRRKSRKYYQNNCEKIKSQITWQWKKLRLKIIDHYTNGQRKCMCSGCDVDILEFLQIDHINNDGETDRKRWGAGPAFYYYIIRNNFPKKYRILCMNCNIGRGYTKNKICPHLLENNK